MSFEKYEPYVCPMSSAYVWRNDELARTDILVSTPDHPERENLLAYRTLLRDWPSTEDFPNTRPVLGE
tara:strand:+ start:406 stop:609 length:204 start_codon:yes stop_codon:yes gene_type:complete